MKKNNFKKYTSVNDIEDLEMLIKLALDIKSDQHAFPEKGKNKTLGLLFFNPSLRTRLSTQKAAQNLGMQVMVMNVGQEGWQLEFEDGAVMNGDKAEHVKEAARVVSQYCDIIGVRSFPGLKDKKQDKSDLVVNAFVQYATVPVISLEGSFEHPLQALADIMTIIENKKKERPKVVLTWAPHPKALPHSVPNAFALMMQKANVDFVITHPEGYELDPEITKGTKVIHDQDAAFQDADFIYAKNWSAYHDYGKILSQDPNWTVTKDKMALTSNAGFMHCLPVRRNVIVTDEVLDSKASLVIQQAGNRTYAAQAILTLLLENEK